jgi:hypothetical protein
MAYPSYAEKPSSWHLTGGGTKEKVRWIRKTQPIQKPIGVTVKVWITSLNSHFTPKESGTKCGGLLKIAKVWIKVCNSQSEPDWSIKKAEPKLRSVLWKTHKRNSPRTTCTLLPVLTSIRRIVSESLYIFLLVLWPFEKSTSKKCVMPSTSPSLFFTF